MEGKTPGIPISAQFADILTHDLADFIHSLEVINSPENNQLVSLARQAKHLCKIDYTHQPLAWFSIEMEIEVRQSTVKETSESSYAVRQRFE